MSKAKEQFIDEQQKALEQMTDAEYAAWQGEEQERLIQEEYLYTNR